MDKREWYVKAIRWTAMFLGIVGAILCICLIIVCRRIDSDITSWQARAVASSEAEDIALYMGKVQQGMIAWGMTEGNASLILPTPKTDMGLIYKQVEVVVESANALEGSEKTADYYTAVANLRAGAGVELYAEKYYLSHKGLGLLIGGPGCLVLGWTLFVIWIVKNPELNPWWD